MTKKAITSAVIMGICFATIGVGAYVLRTPIRDYIDQINRPDLPPEKAAEALTTTTTVATPTEVPNKMALNLAVPFTSQAPHQNWDMPYQEACEEASTIMVNAFYKNKPLSANEADEAIKALVDWQVKTFGYYKDTTAAEVGRIMKEYFGYKNVLVSKDISEEFVRAHIAAGHPVMIPAAGRLLGNPNFHAPGPLFHMLVIKGFIDSGLVITNDPGTRKGKDYLYSWDTLKNAIHDWNDGDVLGGEKVIIVAY